MRQWNSVRARRHLAALAGHALAARVCLLLPASEMIFRRFTLPKKGSVEFSRLAEETLIGDVDTSLDGAQQEGAEVDAVAIDAARLQYWLTAVPMPGWMVVQVLPDAILLPVTEGGSTLVSTDSGYWMRSFAFWRL